MKACVRGNSAAEVGGKRYYVGKPGRNEPSHNSAHNIPKANMVTCG